MRIAAEKAPRKPRKPKSTTPGRAPHPEHPGLFDMEYKQKSRSASSWITQRMVAAIGFDTHPMFSELNQLVAAARQCRTDSDKVAVLQSVFEKFSSGKLSNFVEASTNLILELDRCPDTKELISITSGAQRALAKALADDGIHVDASDEAVDALSYAVDDFREHAGFVRNSNMYEFNGDSFRAAFQGLVSSATVYNIEFDEADGDQDFELKASKKWNADADVDIGVIEKQADMLRTAIQEFDDAVGRVQGLEDAFRSIVNAIDDVVEVVNDLDRKDPDADTYSTRRFLSDYDDFQAKAEATLPDIE